MIRGNSKRRLAYLCSAAIALLLFAAGHVDAQKQQAIEKQKNVPGASKPIVDRERDLPRERERFFYEQRAYPYKTIPGGARLRAVERMEEMRRAEREREARGRARVESIITAQSTWTFIGPQPTDSRSFGLTSGRVSALAVDRTNQDIVYAGGAQGGIWKTTDGGTTWVQLTDDQPSLAVGSIAIDPSSCAPGPCTTIYVGTGEQVNSGDSYYGAGILKSTDGGQSWTQLGQSVFVGPFSAGFAPGGGARIGTLAVKNDGSVILAGVQIFVSTNSGATSGIYRSTDGGVNWTQVLSGAVGSEVFFDPVTPNIAYAALGSANGDSDNGVYKSLDSGATWTKMSAGLPTTNAGRFELAIAPSSPNILYAGVADSSTDDLLGFFKSADGAQTWTQLNATPDYCSPQCWYDHVIRVHPNNPSVVYAGGAATSQYLTRSIDGGATWASITQTANPSAPIHVDQHAMAFGFTGATATTLYLGNDGGVWRADVSNPAGSVTWVNLNNQLGITQFYDGPSIHPSDEQAGIAGTQDNGTQIFSGQLQWQEVTCGDGGWTAIDPVVPSTIYAACQQIAIRRSYQNGARGSFVLGLTSGINASDSVAFIAPLIIDNNNPSRLYFGTSRVYQTNDQANNWVAMGAFPGTNNGVSRSLALAPSDSNFLYACTSTGRVFRSINAGAGAAATFTDITSASDLPPRVCTQIAVHPTDPNTAFAVFSGFSGSGSAFLDTKGHVFKTTNGGASWSDISGTGMGALPNIPVNDIIVDPAPPSGNVGDTIYIATDVGVFVTTDGGSTWNTLVTGLPRVAVFGLALRHVSRTLRAVTHGRGVWDLQLAGVPSYVLTAVSPTSFAIGAGGTLDVRGNGFVPGTSVITFNGMPLIPTTCADANHCSAALPGSLLTGGPPAAVRVDTSPGPGLTNSLAVTVLNPTPTLASISPTSVASGSGAAMLTASGLNFVSSSMVHLDGTALTTAVLTPGTQLTANIPASVTASSGVHRITVFTPAPGGGTSTSQIFSVTGPPPANDDFSGAVNATPTPFTHSVNSGFATTQTTDPVPPTSCTTGQSATNHSVWYRFTAPGNGAVVADTTGSMYDSVLIVVTGSPGAFTIVTCDDDGVAPGGASRVTFTATFGVTYFIQVTDWSGVGGVTTFNLTFTGPPANDDIQMATVVNPVPFTDMISTTAASVASSDPALSTICASGAANAGRGRSVWYRYLPSASGTITADTSGSSYDTILAAFTGSPSSLTNVACNDDSVGLTSSVSVAGVAGTTYWFMISDYSDAGGSLVFHVNGSAPAADYNVSFGSTSSITVVRGQTGTATFSVAPIAGSFSSAISFSCSGLPSLSACSFNPASVTPGGSSVNVTLSISTTAPSMLPPSARRAPPLGPLPIGTLALLAATLLALALRIGRGGQRLRPAHTIAMSAAVVLLALLAACGGGGGGGGSGGGGGNPGTPTGTFPITVNATSGAIVRTTTINLVVQ